MKRLYYILFCLLIMFQTKGQQASLVVIPEKGNKTICYWFSDGEHLSYYTLSDTVRVVSDGTFHIRIPIEQSTAITLLTENHLSFRIYLTKGCHDTLRIQNNEPVFSGTNHIYNQCLQEIQKAEEYCQSISYSRKHELSTVDSLETFKQKVDEKRTKLISFLKEKKDVSSDFIRNQSHIIDCMFTHLYYKKALSLYNSKKITDKWLSEIKKRLAFDFELKANRLYSDYERMLYMNVIINHFIIENHSPNEIDREMLNTLLFNEYKKRATGRNLEYAWANLIYYDIFQEDFSKDIPSLYEQFHAAYPQSKFINILSPYIENIRRFHQAPEATNNITILPPDTTIRNLEEAVRPFTGKVVYVDLWATWCSPCQQMFAYGETLKKATKEMDIIYVYISIDRPEDREKWKKMVHYYKLEGYHLQAGTVLAHSLYASLGDNGMLSIPQFIIIGKDGKVAIKKAAAPDSPEKVVEQLKQVSNE